MPSTTGLLAHLAAPRGPHAATARVLAAMACLLALTACVSSPAGPHALPDARPADFALGLTVYTPDGAVRRPGQRAARYVVEPDGQLRAAVGQGATVSTRPDTTRRLTDAQRDQIWDAVRATGLADVSPALRLTSPETFDAPSGRRVYLVEITAGGRRSAVAMPEGEPETEPFIDLADTLADLAWVRP